MKKITALLLSTSMVLTLSACGGAKSDDSANVSGGKKVTVDFWSAPNTKQVAFWNKMAADYAKDHPNVEIKVSQMPESPTSEAGIQSAIASGTAPTMSENITRGFAAQLAENKAIVNIGETDQFKKVVTDRKMEKTISNWKLADGSQYVMPVFSISDMIAWRTDILKEIGVNEPPKTYSEMLAVGEKLKAKYPDKFLYFNDRISQPTYYFRWTDFFMFYNAATNGNMFVEGNKMVADGKAATDVFSFFKKLSDNKYLLSQKANDAFETGLAVSRYLRTSDVATWKDKFPNLKFGENYAVAPVPVPDGVSTADVKTFADAKGLVVYASATKEQQTAALDFMQWLLSDAKHDLELMQATYNTPARDDVDMNDTFKAFLDENPAIKVFGQQVPNGIPTMNSPKMVDIHTILGEKGVNPIVNNGADPAAAWAQTETEIKAALSKK